MSWKLKVWEYGKIKQAEIEVAPLTLFVGDNNSGKSYLMSLLWGIQNFGISAFLDAQREGQRMHTQAGEKVMDWIGQMMRNAEKNGSWDACVDEIADELQTILQEGVNQNKNHLLKKIFNSPEVKIKAFQIELIDLDKTNIHFVWKKDGRNPSLSWGRVGIMEKGEDRKDKEDRRDKENKRGREERTWEIAYSENADFSFLQSVTLQVIFSLAMEIPISGAELNRYVYLPAARTGFMLTKDVINKVGRNAVFNLGTEKEELTPFTRPINQFLDVMNDLTLDKQGKEGFGSIVEYLEETMAEGNVEMSTLPNKEVMYFPAGRKKGFPLRVVSAVVTEISPLILMLKHKPALNWLFYEEPEMCLHPQLQQKMARVICQLVNTGLWMTITTHSDIILQHINNMIRLSGREDAEEIRKQLGYTPLDVLEAERVKVYQMKVNSRGKTEVEELLCGENGFAVPTFNDALDKIMDEAYLIQE